MPDLDIEELKSTNAVLLETVRKAVVVNARQHKLIKDILEFVEREDGIDISQFEASAPDLAERIKEVIK